MKVISKAMIKEAAKYIVMVDYKAGKGNNGFDYHELNAKTITEAMDEAFTYKTDDVYLVKVLEKCGAKVDDDNDPAFIAYHGIITCRSYGWHTDTNRENSEVDTYVGSYFCKAGRKILNFGYSLMTDEEIDEMKEI